MTTVIITRIPILSRERQGTRRRTNRSADGHVSTLIHEISLMIAKLFNRQVKGYGLTRSQWQVLYLLYTRGPLTQTKIAESLMIAAPPLGKIIDRLELGNWIKRRTDARDKRAKQVVLTSKIERYLDELTQLVDDIGNFATEGLTEKQTEQFIKALKTVHANLKSAL